MSVREREQVRLPLQTGGALQVYLSFTGEPREWAVLYVHGFGSTRAGEKAAAFETACARRDWTFASFDFRGHGESTGTLLELRGTGLLADLAAVRDYLVERGVHRYYLVGSSMGGWAAAWFALRHADRVPACALLAPAFDFVRSRWAGLTEDERAHWRQTGRHRFQNQWVDAEVGYGLVEEIDLFPVETLASGLTVPLLIFQGMRDDVVPFTDSLRLLEQSGPGKAELRLYKDGDHRLLSRKDEMAEAACVFFSQCLTAAEM
jgi:pimeloyl-ACP methyl ester carboxylesterase